MSEIELIQHLNQIYEFRKRYKFEYLSFGEVAYHCDCDRKTAIKYAKELQLVVKIEGVRRVHKERLQEIKDLIKQKLNKRN